MIAIVRDKGTGAIVSIKGDESFTLDLSSPTEIVLTTGIDKVTFTISLLVPITDKVETTDAKSPPVTAEWVLGSDGYWRATLDGRDLAVWQEGGVFLWQVSEGGATSYTSKSKDLEEACRAAEAAIDATRGGYVEPAVADAQADPV